MRNSDLTESLVLAEWAQEECRHLDLIASWETLLSIYEQLGFFGPGNDEVRLAEFKQVIGEVNKFLTKMRNGLTKAADIESAVEYLRSNLNTANVSEIKSRPSVAYNKLKQQWLIMSIARLLEARPQGNAEEGERDE